ncbi:hypothetical protein Tco_0813772 [Tanacetum coccineum]
MKGDKGKELTIQDAIEKALRKSPNKFAVLENLKDRLKEAEEIKEKNEDVLNGGNVVAQKCSANDVNGMDSSVLY